MKDKLTKAYRTAWRWPEVYSETRGVVWLSRAIAIGIPLFIVVLTYLSCVFFLGWLPSLILAGSLGLGFILLTISLFYGEYPTVEDFEAKEARIKDFFLGFPSLTDIPVIENRENEWIAYGHIDPPVFIDAIHTVLLHVTEDKLLADEYLILTGKVEHCHATFRNWSEDHWDEGLDSCTATTKDCFPITRVTKES